MTAFNHIYDILTVQLDYLCNIHVIWNCTSITLSVIMDHKLKLVDYSDSDTEPEESETVPVTQQEPPPMRDSQGRQVAVVGPTPQHTPQHVAVVHPMEAGGGDEEDLNGTGIFEADENDPLSTQATQGSSSPNDQIDPYFVSQEIAESLEIEISRENVDIIVISDCSQDTIIISEHSECDDHRSATSGIYSSLNIFILQK